MLFICKNQGSATMSVDVFITILCVCSLEFCGLSCSRLRPWSMKLPIVYKLLTKTLCFNTVLIKSFMFAFRMPHKFNENFSVIVFML